MMHGIGLFIRYVRAVFAGGGGAPANAMIDNTTGSEIVDNTTGDYMVDNS